MKTGTRGNNLVMTMNNYNVSYDDMGEGEIPIIFLHGFPFDKNAWNSQLEFLKPEFRAIAIDIRGFGKSKDEESPLSIDLFADDLIAFMDALSIEKAIVCGLSMGGFITLNAQNRYPHRFEAMILCDTQCISDTAEVRENRYKTIDDIKENGVSDFNEKFVHDVFHKNSIENKRELVRQLRSVVFTNSQQIICQGLVALAERSETCSTLSNVSIPTLIICGREDIITPLAQSEMMRDSITSSTLEIIEEAGHVSNLEQPKIFNKLIYDFLKIIEENNEEKLNEELIKSK